MPQRKLDYYYLRRRASPPGQSSSSSCGASFLDLPYQIRYRIYLLSGLVRFCPINLNQEGPRAHAQRHLVRNPNEVSDDDMDTEYVCFFESRRFMGKCYEDDCVPGCKCPPLPSALLYVSRAVSEEVLRILYSENVFTIGRSDLWGLKPLHNLSPVALSCLRSLTVRLNNCKCVYGKSLYYPWKDEEDPLELLCDFKEEELQPLGLFPCNPMCRYGVHDKALRKQARQHVAVVREWQVVVNKLAAHCQLDSLRLDLVCDAQDMETADDFVSRLSGLTNLRACSIRLSQNPSWEYSVLARQAVFRLLGQSPEEEGVAARNSRPKTYYLPAEILTHIPSYSDLVAPFDLEWRPDKGLVPFDCCKTCTATLDCCTCSFYCGAYSSNCTCWRVPVPIFLVSRQVYGIAMRIFYERNRFIVLPRGGRVDDMVTCNSGLPDLAEFLRRIPPTASSLLRCIGLAFPDLDFPGLEPKPVVIDQRLLAKWEASLIPLFTQCSVAKLSLAFLLGHGFGVCETLADKAAELRSSYRPLIKALIPLGGGLQDFFALMRQRYYYPAADSMGRLITSQFEQEVMGPDYDSEAREKWAHIPRLWYDGESREGPVFAADGRRVWPREDHYVLYGPAPAIPYIYI
ncbi:hypothetical protein MGN70_012351 [Eutypa lata]|nr:hypothetical protein MGN70_012351 [Eutypa lata]